MRAALLICAALALCVAPARAQDITNTYTGMIKRDAECKAIYEAQINKYWADDEACRNLIFQASNSTTGTADRCTDAEIAQIKETGATLACCPDNSYDSEFQACFSKNHNQEVMDGWKAALKNCELFWIVNRADSAGESEGAIKALDNTCLPRFNSMASFMNYFLKSAEGAASATTVAVSATVAASLLVVMLVL